MIAKQKGIIYKKLAYSLSEENPFQIMEDTYSGSSSEYPFHDMHFENELGIALKGKVRRFFPEGRYDCSTGDAWTCGIWEPHGMKVLEKPCRMMIIVIWPPFLANTFFPEAPTISLLSAFTHQQKVFRFGDPSRRMNLLSLSEQMIRIAGDRRPISLVRKRILLTNLILCLLESGRNIIPRNAKTSETCKLYSRISPALDLVFNSKSQITISDAARKCSMGEDQFTRTFDSIMGISFAEFARRHRISGAANALLSSDLPIKDIADEWGFTDQSHMHRLFLKYYSCSPNEYRTRRERTNRGLNKEY